jgi:hypothetical protein
MRLCSIAASSLLFSCLLSGVALARGPERDSVAQAEVLFRSGKEADARGDLETACSKFAESQALDPAVGTLLNLADCESRSGKTHEAIEHYQAARAEMTPDDPRRRFASDQIAALTPAAPTSSVSSTPTRDAVSSPAPLEDVRFEVAAMLGYASDDMSFGLGVRAGKVVFSHIYVGGTFIYQLGDSTSSGGGGDGIIVNSSSSISAYYLGAEAGYDFVFPLGSSALVLRPYAGIGMDGYTTSVSVSGTGAPGVQGSSSSTKMGVAFWPGACAKYAPAGSSFFLTVDARAITVPGGPAFGSFAGAGMHF